MTRLLVRKRHVLAATTKVVDPTVAYAAQVVADGAVNYWPLDDTSGLSARDIIGGKNGTISGGVTLNQVGPLAGNSKAMLFNGSTGKIITAAAAITIGAQFTLEVWLKTTTAGDLPILDCFPAGGWTSRCTVDTYPAGISFSSGGNNCPTTPAVNTGQWRHIVALQTTNNQQCYVDGVLKNSGAGSIPTIGTGQFLIGTDNIANFWPGSLAQIAIYPFALTPTQIANHYSFKAPALTYSQQVVADGASNYWRLNETSGLSAVDSVGGKNGTISGGVTLNQAGPVSGGKAMLFDGLTGQILTALNVILPIPCSFEVWFKGSVSTAGGIVSNTAGGDGTGDFILIQLQTTNLRVYVEKSAGGGSPSVQPLITIIDNQWHHLVGVLTSTNMTGYVDGANATTFGVTGLIGSTNKPISIGASVKYSQFTPGSIAEIAIYPLALTPTQIASHYAAR